MNNNKPDEATLISYLYGELADKEMVQVERYFQQHPEELVHVQQLKDTLKLMGNVQDKEVIAPPILESTTVVKSLWQSSYFRIPMSIAASFLLIMIAGKILGTEVNYSRGELSIRFGAKQEVMQPVQENLLTQAQVQQMINTSLTQNNQSIASNWSEQQELLNKSIQTNLHSNSKKVDDLIKTASLASQDQVRSFVAGLQSENLQMMKDYLQLSSNDQKKYIEGLLVDFSKYLQEQRNQDLTAFQTKILSLEKNTDQFKQETEQILASIISGPEDSKKTNNY
jgi:hypothetical protein